MSRPSRETVDPEYRFDLSAIYETPAEWDRAYESLRSRLDDVRSLADEPPESAEGLRELLDAVADCFRRRQRLDLYATLASDIATDDDEAADRQRRARDLTESFDPAVTAALRAVRDAPDRLTEALPDDRRWYAENCREQAAFVRGDAVEETLAAFEEPADAASRTFRTVWNDDFDPPTVDRPDGETATVRYGDLQSELSHPDRDYRERVFRAFYREADRYEHVMTRAFAEKVAAARAEATVRGYDSVRDRAFRQRCYPESGLRSALPGAVHDTMLRAVRENLDPYHDALALRRRRLGVDALRPWDLDVSIADTDPPDIEYEAAKEHILSALEPLGDDYVDRLRGLFDERRIDVFPTEAKREDIPAYCPSSADDGAYVLANFQGDVRTTFYLCHELGHAMHVEHERSGPTRYATAPRPVEEVPSILHELLLVEHFVAEGGALADAARNRLLECIGGNFYGATRSSVFTHELAERVADGEALTVERTRDLAASLRAEFLAPVEFGDRPGRRLPVSGTRELYSNYQYVLGATGALAARALLREGELSTATYREFLRSTGRERSVALFDRLGCDVRTAEPFERAAETFGEYVAAFEAD